MADRQPTTQRITTAEAGREFQRLVKQVSKGRTRVLVEDDGAPVVAIVSAHDLEKLNRLEAERRQEFTVLDEIRAAFRDAPPAEVEREVAKALATARKEMRAEREGHQHNSRA